MALAAAGRMEPAAQCYAHALSRAPLLAEAHLGLGRARAAQGNPNAAIASLWQCRRLYPEDTEARIALADALRACGYELAALRQERRAAAPPNTAKNTAGRRLDEAEAARQLARALAAAGHCEDAEAEILRAVIFDPDNPQDPLALSAVYEQQERLDEAADALRLALEGDGSNAAAHIALGGILARLGELDSAEASLVRTAVQN
jgi:tetratricopeptide (TPR) repeat protein